MSQIVNKKKISPKKTFPTKKNQGKAQLGRDPEVAEIGGEGH
jgi:hypothetical protein